MSTEDEEFLDLSPAEVLKLAEALESTPWPEDTSSTTLRRADVKSGPDFHLTVLVATDTFPDDEDGAQARAAMERVGTRIRAVEDAAAQRWGAGQEYAARRGPDRGIIDQMMTALGFSTATLWERTDALIVLFGGHPAPRLPIHQVLMVCPPTAIPEPLV